jgi:hypothetical protein
LTTFSPFATSFLTRQLVQQGNPLHYERLKVPSVGDDVGGDGIGFVTKSYLRYRCQDHNQEVPRKPRRRRMLIWFLAQQLEHSWTV